MMPTRRRSVRRSAPPESGNVVQHYKDMNWTRQISKVLSMFMAIIGGLFLVLAIVATYDPIRGALTSEGVIGFIEGAFLIGGAAIWSRRIQRGASVVLTTTRGEGQAISDQVVRRAANITVLVHAVLVVLFLVAILFLVPIFGEMYSSF